MSGLEELPREKLIALVREQAGLITQLREANAALEERVRRLERLVSRNSGNSSMPPSTDDLPGRAKPAARRARKSGRARGKQQGAKGSALSWMAMPDETVPHRPQGSCRCGANLADAQDVRIERSHQVHDLPEVQIRVWQHDVYRVRCDCGAEHVGQLPPEVSTAPASYGANIRALVVYLLVYQHVPVQRCVRLIADLTGGTGPSDGFVHGMLARGAAAVTEVVTGIKTLITLAHVVGFDETTLRCGQAGRKNYVLSASTENACAYYLGGRPGVIHRVRHPARLRRHRGARPLQRLLPPPLGHPGRTSSLYGASAPRLADAAETYPDAHWPAQAQRALRGLITAWHAARAAGLPAIPVDVREPLVTEFRQAVRVGLSQVPRVPGPRSCTAQRPGRELLEFCRDRQDDVVRFTTDTRIWPTNNISERDLRPTKTQQKISGRLTSEDTTQDRLDIRSYIDTARKHGINVMTALRNALSGAPWTPPLPAPT